MQVGTPENPEILEADGTPLNRPRTFKRWRAAFTLLTWIVAVCLPALFINSVCYWLFTLIVSGSLFAWILLALMIVPALVTTLFAVAVGGFLFLALLATLMGGPMVVSRVPWGRYVGGGFDPFRGNPNLR